MSSGFAFHVERAIPSRCWGTLNYGRVLILINRSDYFQAGLIIPKGSFEQTKHEGIDAFRETIRRIAPYLGNRVDELQSWEQIKLLTVQINRLRKWHLPGLLLIGDAAHAMSPAGGVGINLAIQDAVAAANLLAGHLRQGSVTEALLARVQQRRGVSGARHANNAGECSIGVRPEHVAGVPRRQWSLKKAAVHAGALLGGVVAAVRTL